MGTVFQKTTVRPVPKDARRLPETRAKWTPRGSTRPITAEITVHPDGRETVAVPTGNWYARYREADGRLVTESTGCKDESNARQWLAAAERRVEQVKAGVLSPRQAAAAARTREPIADVFAAFANQIRGKRGGPPSPVHVANVRRYLCRLAADLGWRTLPDLSRESLDAWIGAQTRAGRSAASINRHLTAAKAFARWASDPAVGRLPSNPFIGVRGTNEDEDPRRRRRALTPTEVAALIAAARNAPARGRRRLDGADRADLWAFLAATGLRVGEVRALRVADVRLDAVPPFIQIPASVAKARKAQAVPVRSDLIPMLTARLADKAPDAPVFAIPADLSKRFDSDLARAGIAKRAADGRTVDVHALRHTFITRLAAAGVAPRVAMALARHSRLEQTMTTYVDPALLPAAAALESTAPGPKSFQDNPKGTPQAVRPTPVQAPASVVTKVVPRTVIRGQFGASGGNSNALEPATQTAPEVA